jgi:hypothetical protein
MLGWYIITQQTGLTLQKSFDSPSWKATFRVRPKSGDPQDETAWHCLDSSHGALIEYLRAYEDSQSDSIISKMV